MYTLADNFQRFALQKHVLQHGIALHSLVCFALFCSHVLFTRTFYQCFRNQNTSDQLLSMSTHGAKHTCWRSSFGDASFSIVQPFTVLFQLFARRARVMGGLQAGPAGLLVGAQVCAFQLQQPQCSNNMRVHIFLKAVHAYMCQPLSMLGQLTVHFLQTTFISLPCLVGVCSNAQSGNNT